MTKMNKEQFLRFFRYIPVSINNLYGDPFFPLQRENTLAKLSSLRSTNHEGIVSIITKSELTEADILAIKATNLKVVILVSISELPNKKQEGTPYELTTGNRYNTLALCRKHNLSALAYVRPFVPPFNTSHETIRRMFAKIATTGIKNVIVSGLRGDDTILAKTGLTKSEYDKWSWRVKKIPKTFAPSLIKKVHQWGFDCLNVQVVAFVMCLAKITATTHITLHHSFANAISVR